MRTFCYSYRPSDKQIGALGVTHDWSISRRIMDLASVPVILAGGLGPDNVAEAIRTVRPADVDSKESAGSTKRLWRRRRHSFGYGQTGMRTARAGFAFPLLQTYDQVSSMSGSGSRYKPTDAFALFAN